MSEWFPELLAGPWSCRDGLWSRDRHGLCAVPSVRGWVARTGQGDAERGGCAQTGTCDVIRPRRQRMAQLGSAQLGSPCSCPGRSQRCWASALGGKTAAPRGSAQARVERSCGQGRKAAPTAGPFQTLRAPGRAVLGAAGGPGGDLPAGASCLCRVREAPSHPSGHLSCLRFLLWSEPLQSIPESFGGSFSSPGLWAAEPVPPGRDMRESRGGRV